MTSPCVAATSCSKASGCSSADILSKPLHQQPNVHDSPRVRSNMLCYHVDVYHIDDTIFSLRFEPEDCMRTFSQSEPTRLLSSLQCASLSQQHRLRCHKIQGPIHQYPQVPTVSLVPCPTLLNAVPTHFTHDEIQRVATKPDPSTKKEEKEKEEKIEKGKKEKRKKKKKKKQKEKKREKRREKKEERRREKKEERKKKRKKNRPTHPREKKTNCVGEGKKSEKFWEDARLGPVRLRPISPNRRFCVLRCLLCMFAVCVCWGALD